MGSLSGRQGKLKVSHIQPASGTSRPTVEGRPISLQCGQGVGDTPKPLAQVTVQDLTEVQVCTINASDIPPTPVTPVSAEAVASLRDLVEQGVYLLDETKRQHLQRRLQKLINATQLSSAERALLRQRNHFPIGINNEAKVRRSTKSKVIGTARVVSYEDLEKTRAERAGKEAEKEAKKMEKEARKVAKTTAETVVPIVGKKQRGRKRNAATSSSCAPETGVSAAGSRERQPARYKQGVNVPESEVPATSLYEGHTEKYASAPEQYKAPVAPMW